ncbi:MAG TPA: TIGR03557 family F420-dependent LLM class oxidoreductase [Nitrososphaerales archaeon]|nr:TIGR03557 family F420-dependent LLM class oxidoreductase [Nitrososphaerales archaeon]
MHTRILRKGSVGFNANPDMVEANKLLRQVKLAEESGFEAIWPSDHFHPWFDTGAAESNTWVWMAAAMKEVHVPFGTAVTAPLFRYHPAIVAQAFATMESIFGHRLLLGVGTGEAMNESPLGYKWPRFNERRDRLIEAVQVIRRLWSGEKVDFDGSYYKLRGAKLYLRAEIPIIISAMGPKMARVAGKYGDGFITSGKTTQAVNEILMPGVKAGAAESGKSLDDLIKVAELDIAYDQDYDRAVKVMRKWAATTLDEVYNKEISDPAEIERLGNEKVSDEQLAKVYPIVTSPEEVVKAISEYFGCGFDHVYVQLNTNDDDAAIRMFQKEVLPHFK